MKAKLAGKKWDDGMDGYGTLKSVLINTDFCGRSKWHLTNTVNKRGYRTSDNLVI